MKNTLLPLLVPYHPSDTLIVEEETESLSSTLALTQELSKTHAKVESNSLSLTQSEHPIYNASNSLSLTQTLAQESLNILKQTIGITQASERTAAFKRSFSQSLSISENVLALLKDGGGGVKGGFGLEFPDYSSGSEKSGDTFEY